MQTDRTLTLGSIIQQAFGLLLQNLPLILLVTVLLHLPGWFQLFCLPSHLQSERFTVALVLVPFSFLFACLARGLLISSVAYQLEGRPVGFGEVFGFSLKRVLPMIWTTVCYLFWFYLGLVLFIVPGVLWAFRQLFAETVTMLEGISGPGALRRSHQLIKVNQGLVATLVLMQVALFLVISFPQWLALSQGVHLERSFGFLIFSTLATICFQVCPISLVILFRHLRDRLEHQPVDEEVGVGLNPH